ncbi:hypothetical protein GGF37_006190, partial [Kickxella alabastrina]
MSFPVLLKMLSDSSEQVVKLDLELFAQISLYSLQQQQEQQLSPLNLPITSTTYNVDPHSMPYLSRFLGSLLQMFATDRVLLETRAALMVRQLCVVLDPQLVFCLFARLLVLPRFSIDLQEPPTLDKHDMPTTATAAIDAAADDATSERGYGILNEDIGAGADDNGDVEGLGESVANAVTGVSRADRQPQLSTIDEGAARPNDGHQYGGRNSVCSLSDYSDSDYEFVEPASPEAIANDIESAESHIDLEFISVMVQHLSWILVTAPETEKLRLILRRYSVTLAAYVRAPKLQSVRDALSAPDSRPMSCEMPTQSAPASSTARGRPASSSVAGASGVRRRGASFAGGLIPAITAATAPTAPTATTATTATAFKDAAKPGRSSAGTGSGSANLPSGVASTQPRGTSGSSNISNSASASASASAQPALRGAIRSSASDGDKQRLRADRGSRQLPTQRSQRSQQQQQQQRQQMEAAQKNRRARHVLSSAIQRIQQDIEDNQHSHGLFVALFRTWSHNPAACLTLCLLSQHYEIGAELINAFGQLAQDLTVSFLVQLDKLV